MNISLKRIQMKQKIKTLNLFEFGDWVKYESSRKDFADFEQLLNGIWNNRHLATLGYGEEETSIYDEEEAKEQRFFKIKQVKQRIRARNYVGVIRYDNTVINILPKIFNPKNMELQNEDDLQKIHAHMLWWLSYCSKLSFPKTWSNFNHIKSNFFEVLIYLFANYTKETLSKLLYQTYQEVANELPYMKGRLNMPHYIQQNLAKGRWHRLSCVYDSFEFDNRFNRIIKYVAKLLLSATQSVDNKRLLGEIIFILDDVGDQRMTIHDCQKVSINPLYRELHPILDYCRLFLSNSTILQYKDELEVFAFLLPMETIFEDFVFGFMKTHLQDNDTKIHSQKKDKYLASLWYGEHKEKEKVFQLQHDIFIEKKHSSNIIIDTKYKLIYTNTDNADKKHGISQGDLYQMVSYAIRRKCQKIKLIYPNVIHRPLSNEKIKFQVNDELADKKIAITVHQISVLDNTIEILPHQGLSKTFEHLEHDLKLQLRNIVGNQDYS